MSEYNAGWFGSGLSLLIGQDGNKDQRVDCWFAVSLCVIVPDVHKGFRSTMSTMRGAHPGNYMHGWSLINRSKYSATWWMRRTMPVAYRSISDGYAQSYKRGRAPLRQWFQFSSRATNFLTVHHFRSINQVNFRHCVSQVCFQRSTLLAVLLAYQFEVRSSTHRLLKTISADHGYDSFTVLGLRQSPPHHGSARHLLQLHVFSIHQPMRWEAVLPLPVVLIPVCTNCVWVLCCPRTVHCVTYTSWYSMIPVYHHTAAVHAYASLFQLKSPNEFKFGFCCCMKWNDLHFSLAESTE
jgi:hypothetical protein